MNKTNKTIIDRCNVHFAACPSPTFFSALIAKNSIDVLELPLEVVLMPSKDKIFYHQKHLIFYLIIKAMNRYNKNVDHMFVYDGFVAETWGSIFKKQMKFLEYS